MDQHCTCNVLDNEKIKKDDSLFLCTCFCQTYVSYTFDYHYLKHSKPNNNLLTTNISKEKGWVEK